MPAGSILVADDDAAIRTVLNQALSRAGYEVRSTGNAATLWRWISQGDGDLVITDVVMPDENAFDLLPRIKKARPDLPVIVMSAQNTFMTAIRASERGAYEYLPKPFDLKELIAIVGRALSEPKERARQPAKAEDFESIPLVGRSPAMQEIYRVLARLMQTDLTVMISGESGTGKELVARALHDYGKRRSGPFVAINMAAIPRDLIESELFGHEKGAFTGANTRSAGRFEQAEGGTLFLDEIGDMPMEAQTRLLRVLQQGEYTTVGGRTPIKADVRIIAATNKDLRQLIQQGLFREDLFFRLNVVPLRLPPLRERTEDIPDLIRHFFAQVEREGLPPKQIDQAALDRLKRHRWPGNVRELENLARRLAALYPQETITAAVIDAELSQPALVAPGETSRGEDNLSSAVERYLARYFAGFDDGLPPPGLYHRILREVEGPLLSAALAATRGNQIRAADLLGVNRNTLRKKIRDLDIQVYPHQAAELRAGHGLPRNVRGCLNSAPGIVAIRQHCCIKASLCADGGWPGSIRPAPYAVPAFQGVHDDCRSGRARRTGRGGADAGRLPADRGDRGRLALLSAIATFLVLAGLTPIAPVHEVVVTLLLGNAVTGLLLLGIIGREVWVVVQARRRGRAGSRLHVRIVGLFAVIAAVPDHPGRGGRQHDARPRPRPLLLDAHPRHDRAIADRGRRLCARARPERSAARSSAMAYRPRPRQADVRPGPRPIPQIPHRAGERARPVRGHHHQARRHHRRARRRHHGQADRAAVAGAAQPDQRDRAAGRAHSRRRSRRRRHQAARLRRHVSLRRPSARSARGRSNCARRRRASANTPISKRAGSAFRSPSR